jgi:hypothetical protein
VLRVVVGLTLVAGLCLAACGGGGDESAEKEIAATVERVLGDPEPVDCRRLQTRRYLEQTNRDIGENSLEACEENAREPSTESVVVDDVSIDGSKALARVTYAEGPIEGVSLLIGLVAGDGRWRLDEVVRYVDFDKPRMIEAIEESLTESTDGAKPKVVACISSQLARVPAGSLEEGFISAPKLESLVLEAAKSCRASSS